MCTKTFEEVKVAYLRFLLFCACEKIFVKKNKLEITLIPSIHTTTNAKWMVLTMALSVCEFLPSDRFHPTGLTQSLFSNSEKNIYTRLTLILNTIENKVY